MRRYHLGEGHIFIPEEINLSYPASTHTPITHHSVFSEGNCWNNCGDDPSRVCARLRGATKRSLVNIRDFRLALVGAQPVHDVAGAQTEDILAQKVSKGRGIEAVFLF